MAKIDVFPCVNCAYHIKNERDIGTQKIKKMFIFQPYLVDNATFDLKWKKYQKLFTVKFIVKSFFNFPRGGKVPPKKKRRWVFRIKNGHVRGRGGTLLYTQKTKRRCFSPIQSKNHIFEGGPGGGAGCLKFHEKT